MFIYICNHTIVPQNHRPTARRGLRCSWCPTSPQVSANISAAERPARDSTLWVKARVGQATRSTLRASEGSVQPQSLTVKESQSFTLENPSTPCGSQQA